MVVPDVVVVVAGVGTGLLAAPVRVWLAWFHQPLYKTMLVTAQFLIFLDPLSIFLALFCWRRVS